jgi:hypothetical protein
LCVSPLFIVSINKYYFRVRPDSSVDIATCYGLDGPEIEFWWGQNLPHSFRPNLGPIQPPTKWVLGLFPGSKAAVAWRWPSNISGAEVKEIVKLCLYSPFRSSWPVLRWNFTFQWIFTIKHTTLTFYRMYASLMMAETCSWVKIRNRRCYAWWLIVIIHYGNA